MPMTRNKKIVTGLNHTQYERVVICQTLNNDK